MTAAERKRRSLVLQHQRGGDALKEDVWARVPIPFSTTLDSTCVSLLREVAKEEAVPVYEVLERLIKQALPKVIYRYEGSTWTGRGKQPDWVTHALASGLTLDQLRIAPA